MRYVLVSIDGSKCNIRDVLSKLTPNMANVLWEFFNGHTLYSRAALCMFIVHIYHHCYYIGKKLRQAFVLLHVSSYTVLPSPERGFNTTMGRCFLMFCVFLPLCIQQLVHYSVCVAHIGLAIDSWSGRILLYLYCRYV